MNQTSVHTSEESTIKKESPQKISPWWVVLLKATGLTVLILLVMLLISGGVAGFWAWQKWQLFTHSSGLNFEQVRQIVETGWQKEPIVTDHHKNILLLGTDYLSGRGDAPVLTDTMMIVSIDLETAQITTLSLPRDLYSQEYQTKINALYVYGQDRYPERPETFPEEVVADLTGLEIHHTLVLGMDQVAELIDLVGGVEVNVPVAFKDESFPRADVDVTTETDPAKLYKTIEFQAGKQKMTGETALEYMRSRKSGDDEGTDVARANRQQLVIDALINRLKQKEVLFNPQLLGQLYQFYDYNFSQVIAPQELVAVAKMLYPVRNQIEMQNRSLSIYPDQEDGVIEHPNPSLYQNQWVYVIRDKELFSQEVEQLLGFEVKEQN